MKDVQDWITVKKLYKRGMKIKAISRELGMSKNTVKRLIKLEEEPKYIREVNTTKIDVYKKQIKTWYLEPEFNFIGTRIFRELKSLGYKGSIGPVYRYLNVLKDEKRKVNSNATVRIETPPGDQAQFDWAEYKIVVNNQITKVYCFSMILSSSRVKEIVFSLAVDADAIYEAIQDLFSSFGGVTQELIIDNPKALVIENQKGSPPNFNIDALRMATHLGTELNACNPYRARTKGKVEKPFQYIEEQFIKGNSFLSMEELNNKGKAFMKEWCKVKHSTTQRIPEEAFREERECLLPLPSKRFMRVQPEERKVSLDSFISVKGNKYSVPVAYVGKTVKFRIVYGYKLLIYNKKNTLIAHHELSRGKNEVTRDDLHYKEIQSAVPKSIPEIRRKFVATFERGAEYLEKSSSVIEQSSYHARQILKLQELYTPPVLNQILGYCIDHNIFTIEEVKGILKNKSLEILVENMGYEVAAATTENPGLTRDLSYYGGVNFECKSSNG
jgi:transposase